MTDPGRTAPAALLVLGGLLLVLYHGNTYSPHHDFPHGDSAYFADMTQKLWLDVPESLEYSPIHARRLLGPAIVGLSLRVGDWATGKPRPEPTTFRYDMGDYWRGWYQQSQGAWTPIRRGWHILTGLSFLAILLGLWAVCRAAPDRGLPPAQPALLVVGLLALSPSLGRLYVAFSPMNDLLGIALGLWALAAAQRRRVVVSGVLFGLALLARENLIFVWPCCLWLLLGQRQPPGRLLLHAALSVGPWAAAILLPPIVATTSFVDHSGAAAGEGGALSAYLALLRFHLERITDDPHGVTRQVLVFWYVLGPLLALVVRFGEWRATSLRRELLLVISLALCLATGFSVDRYVVYSLFPLVLLGRRALQRADARRLLLAIGVLYFLTVQIWEPIIFGQTLQVETMSPDRLEWVTACAATAAAALLAHVVIRKEPGS